MKTRTFSFAALAAVFVALLALNGHVSNAAPTMQAAATMDAATIAQTTLLRVVHASPASPNVDVYLDKGATPAIANLAYDTATDGYKVIPAGDHQLTITAAGDTKTVVYDDKVTFTGGTALTVIAEGLLADKSFGIRITVDDVSDTKGQARVKVTHAISDGPNVDLVTADFKTVLVNDLPYGSSITIMVPPGTYDLLVVPHGATDASKAVITLTGTKIDADQIYSVFATGTISSSVAVKPLLFVTSPVPGFAPPAMAPEAPTAAATMAQ